MALSKTDQVRFDGLKQTLTMLSGSGMELEQIKGMMAPQFADFQALTNQKVNVVETENGLSLELLNLSRDFVRVRGTEDLKTLRTKIQGVPVDVKVVKTNDYTFSNEDIVSALRALADEVEALTIEVNTLDITADVRKDFAVDTDDEVSIDTEESTEEVFSDDVKVSSEKDLEDETILED